MLHRNEYYTCDRCGRKIEYNCFSLFPRQRIEVFDLSTLDIPEIESYFSEIPDSLRRNVEKLPDDKIVMEITEHKKRRLNNYHLCPKCRKDFERFMRGE